MHVAIASSGLGHIARGIETWALSLARGLARHAAATPCDGDIRVTLFAAAAPWPGADSAAPETAPGTPAVIVVPCVKRGARAARILARLTPGFAWRWDLKAPYAIEQRTFASALIRRLGATPVDIVHTQDVILAQRLNRAARAGKIRARIILAHGTDEDADALRDIPWIQHLAPAHCAALGSRLQTQGQFVIPNFVAGDTFRPPSSAEKTGCRRANGIAPDSLVIGYSGAVKRAHKRFDALIDEVARLAADGRNVFLLAAGASERETPALIDYARARLPRRHRIGLNIPFADMPDLYRSMDLYVHPAAEEFFGICLLEAMACGVPVVVHRAPVLEWIAGDGGWTADVRRPGFLNDLVRQPGFAETRARKAGAARERVMTTFALDAVCPAFIRMYREVAGNRRE